MYADYKYAHELCRKCCFQVINYEIFRGGETRTLWMNKTTSTFKNKYKLPSASLALTINQYKNMKRKILKCNANIHFKHEININTD